jgi:hypothetical protein
LKFYLKALGLNCRNKRISKEALQSELASHFNQAASTPFCQDPLLSDIGPYATTNLANEILRGNYSPPDLDHWAAQLLPFLQQEIPTEGPKYCSIQQHIAGWKRVKECTSAGPSGITIPHMKAHGRSLFLSNVDTILANLPYVHGFSPTRWRKGLDVMLEKSPVFDRSIRCGRSSYTKPTLIKTINVWEGKCYIERKIFKLWQGSSSAVEKSLSH